MKIKLLPKFILSLGVIGVILTIAISLFSYRSSRSYLENLYAQRVMTNSNSIADMMSVSDVKKILAEGGDKTEEYSEMVTLFNKLKKDGDATYLSLVPSAKIGHIGLYRDPVTHEPHEYYCKLPDPIDQRLIVMVDPMLATGGSAISAVNFIKQHGGKSIKCMFVIAAPEGLKRLHEVHPDVQIYVGHLDRELNDRAYICPGLGDAGDRIFGTK
jgi:hypothetical protein